MKRYIISLFQYLFIVGLILEFCTPYICFSQIWHAIQYVVMFSLLLLVLISTSISYSAIRLALLLIIGGLFPALFVAGDIIAYVKLYFVFLPLCVIYILGLLKSDESKVNTLFFKYSNVMFFLSISSLFFWLFGSILEWVPYTTVIPNNWFDDRFIPTYYGVYFETQKNLFGEMASPGVDAIIKNTGIFNEAPMYSLNLCMALAVECFLRARFVFYRIIIFVATILTTFSTTGYFFLIFIVMVHIIVLHKNKKSCLKPILTILFFSLSVVASSFLLDNKKETGESSFTHRIEDIEKCIIIGFENPITGVGIMHEAKEDGPADINFGFSNSLFTVFAHGGFYFLFLYVFPLFIMPYFNYRKNRNLSSWIMFSFFFLFTFTLSQYWYFTIFLVSLGVAYWYHINHDISYNREVV